MLPICPSVFAAGSSVALPSVLSFGGRPRIPIPTRFAIAAATGIGDQKCIDLVMTGSTEALLARDSLLFQAFVLHLESGVRLIAGAVRNNNEYDERLKRS
jgi:hypothetical protein